MTFNCQAASKSAEFMLVAPVKGSKSEDMQLIPIARLLITGVDSLTRSKPDVYI